MLGKFAALLFVCFALSHAVLSCAVLCCVTAAGRWGGAITAALFLQEFINEGTQWAHLDVAGPAWNEAASLPTGFGAATLAHWVDSLAEQVATQ